ncbi:MAG: hypothetical protein CMH64_01935 [Nanoarchaeota archaeon]|nr:hypothetical protein [Nanoarchaeota archaeon]|tara:strand:- start:639 stop:884 length:246 start_codon:yes stop_codon:yes gene_type:complete
MPTKEQIEEEMESGDREEDIYTEEGRELAEEGDEITNVEEGFMEGYEGGEASAKCKNCKKVLKEDFIESEVNGEVIKFCSE